MGASAVARPDGQLARTFTRAADRQAAYDFLESPLGSHEAIACSMGIASARRCRALTDVIVPVDSSSVTLLEKIHDPARRKDFGLVASDKDGARGIHVVSALVLAADGAVQGVGAMQWWSRGLSPHRLSRAEKERRPIEETELGHWTQVIQRTHRSFEAEAPGVIPWFQLDRGGDSWRLMWWLYVGGFRYTVRARADRQVIALWRDPGPRKVGQQGRYHTESAKTALGRHPVLGTLKLMLRAEEGRAAREATLQVRAQAVVLMLRDPCGSRSNLVPVWAVWVRESGPVPHGAERVEWLLWSNVPALTLEEAARVVGNYVLRWRIEEWHRSWKSSCLVEEMAVHSVEAACRWGTILGAVAARIERLKLLARTTPKLSADHELSPYELRALVILKRMEARRTETIEDTPTIERAVRWIADLGGYDGRPRARPGATVLARGLQRVELVAAVLEFKGDEER
jgi:hypothetical protein